MTKFASRKLFISVLIVLIVAGADVVGAQLDDTTIEAILTMGLGLVGGQSLIDVAEVIKAGRSAARAAEELEESIND